MPTKKTTPKKKVTTSKKTNPSFDYNEIVKRNSICLSISNEYNGDVEGFRFSSLNEAYFFLYHYWKDGGESLAGKSRGISGYLDIQNFGDVLDSMRWDLRENDEFLKQLKKITSWKCLFKKGFDFSVSEDDFGFSLDGMGIVEVLEEIDERYDLETLYPFEDFKNSF